jgi:hypothetical protein
MVEYRPLELGARLMAGRLSLEQLVVVRIHCPQPHIWRILANDPPEIGSKRASFLEGSFFYSNPNRCFLQSNV